MIYFSQIGSDLPINGIFASLRRQQNRSLSELQPAPANHRDQSPLHAINPWPSLHKDASRPNPNPYVDSFYPEAPPPIQFDQTYPPATSSYRDPVPNPPPEAPGANWVDAFFKELASDPQASHQEAGPSGSSQYPDSDILPKFTFNDEIAHASLLTTRIPSRPVQRTKPYDRNRLSTRRSARTRNQNQEEGDCDIVELMHRAIFNGAFMPEAYEVVRMARKSLHPTLDSHADDCKSVNPNK